MDPGRIPTAIRDRDPEEDIVRGGLCILRRDVEVAPVVEYTGVDELELGVGLGATSVLVDEPGVGICRLRILVERLQVRRRRSCVEVVVELLDVLAVISLVTAEA